MASSNTDILKQFFLNVIEGLRQDAEAKGQKFPVSKVRFEADELGGQLYAPHYTQYLFYGRGPGKQPPPDTMTAFVDANPDILERAREVYRRITSQQLGYLIGRKIAREGTEIYTGKKPGIDFLGVLEKYTPELLETLAKNEAIKVATELRSAITSTVPVNG